MRKKDSTTAFREVVESFFVPVNALWRASRCGKNVLACERAKHQPISLLAT
ncbi:hypothetical protein HMPREF0541_00096 [Lacticaseibacillus rhamnosus ATCC 21052]|nr:hypothetical protein HMPREF0541_00096 [Lacticaseibacillus rhamnosus ATCC 21052]